MWKKTAMPTNQNNHLYLKLPKSLKVKEQPKDIQNALSCLISAGLVCVPSCSEQGEGGQVLGSLHTLLASAPVLAYVDEDSSHRLASLGALLLHMERAYVGASDRKTRGGILEMRRRMLGTCAGGKEEVPAAFSASGDFRFIVDKGVVAVHSSRVASTNASSAIAQLGAADEFDSSLFAPLSGAVGECVSDRICRFYEQKVHPEVLNFAKMAAASGRLDAHEEERQKLPTSLQNLKW